MSIEELKISIDEYEKAALNERKLFEKINEGLFVNDIIDEEAYAKGKANVQHGLATDQLLVATWMLGVFLKDREPV